MTRHLFISGPYFPRADRSPDSFHERLGCVVALAVLALVTQAGLSAAA
jgi:hypothetical protein